MKDHVTVIVVSYNTGEFIEQCLDAVFTQSRPADTVCVVDNASNDDSVKIINQKFKHVELIKSKDNVGFAAANNIAIHAAPDQGLIALVNPDAFLDPSWLEQITAAARRHQQHGSFGSKVLLAKKKDALDGVGDVYHVSGLAWRKLHGTSVDLAPTETEEIFSPCAAAALYRTEAIKLIGGFDESYFCYFEDIDLGFRLRLAGYKSMYVPSAVVSHVVSGASGERSDFALYHGQRNLVWTYIKDMPHPLFIKYLPQHVLLNLIALGVFSVQGKGIIWKAKLDALKGISTAWKKRKQIQKARTVTADEVIRVMERGVLTPYTNRFKP